MARANNGGWDFVNVGQDYQVKEEGILYEVKILEDNSDDEDYCFKVKSLKSTTEMSEEPFEISFSKNLSGMFSGMLQIYERPEYYCEYKWFNSEKHERI